MVTQLNLRVYFLLEDASRTRILVSDEIIRGKPYTKFPGGGLEIGEGLIACAHREAMEELGQEIIIQDHLYTTDFFIQSMFRDQDQLISVYYLARLKDFPNFRTTTHRFDFNQQILNEESFRWVAKEELMAESWSFPADAAAVKVFLRRMAEENLSPM